MGELIGFAIVCGFIYLCYYGVCEWWKETTNQWKSNKITREQQQYERGDYYGTFEHTKQTLQSLMQDNNSTDFFTFEYLILNESITSYRRKLGYMYENGYGTAKDYDKAMKCYEKANAWREIGYMHYFGYGVPKNENRARTYFAKCDDEADYKQIISYFERIVNDSNDANALCNLGWHYTEGKGISQDYHKALYYYQKAADLGNKIACNNLGNCYEYDKLYVLFSQYKALKYYKKACDLGNQKGCENYKRLKAQMGITNDDDVLFFVSWFNV